jgi:hypothetical protein
MYFKVWEGLNLTELILDEATIFDFDLVVIDCMTASLNHGRKSNHFFGQLGSGRYHLPINNPVERINVFFME